MKNISLEPLENQLGIEKQAGKRSHSPHDYLYEEYHLHTLF